MNRPDVGAVIRKLREIRGATIQDVATALLASSSELKAKGIAESTQSMSAEEIQRLEEYGDCGAALESLCLLADVLGIGVGYLPWFLDLIYPESGVYRDPVSRSLDLHAEFLAMQQRYDIRGKGFSDQLPISLETAKELYQRTGFVAEFKVNSLLLSRFLRPPFSPERYRIFVVGLTDQNLFPLFPPGSIILVDSVAKLLPQPHPEVHHPCYLCFFGAGHRCGWPVAMESSFRLQTVHSDGTWHDLSAGMPLGVPCQSTCSVNPLERHDFWMDDHRNRETLDYIRSLRHKYPPITIQ